MEQNGNIKVGDKVMLVNYEGSSIGHNGIICNVQMINDKYGYYCESVYGDYRGWSREEHLKKLN